MILGSPVFLLSAVEEGGEDGKGVKEHDGEGGETG